MVGGGKQGERVFWFGEPGEHIRDEVLGPLYMLNRKSYLENQSFNLSNIFSGTVLPLKLRILGKAELSIRIRKWCPIR